jgi:hypothetical protein
MPKGIVFSFIFWHTFDDPGMQNKGGASLLLIDNVAAFFWLDKAIRSTAPAPGQSRHNMWVLQLAFC